MAMIDIDVSWAMDVELTNHFRGRYPDSHV